MTGHLRGWEKGKGSQDILDFGSVSTIVGLRKVSSNVSASLQHIWKLSKLTKEC